MAKHDKVEVGISTILNPVPVVMVSSGSKDGKANIMTVAWAGTVNSEPPMVSVSIRKSRYSHKLISETGEFVINLVSKSLCKACDYCGVRGGENEDKFKSCGLTPVKAEGMEYAYAIKEAPVSISCVVKSVTELGSHDMFIGEIKNVTADSYLLDQNGKICLDNARLVAYNHGEYYLLGEKLGFFGYSVAKEDVIKRRMGKDTKKGKK
ncbi:MAG: flavin reductase family protein [Saccharofermentans sp.]|nr:flavin reductase family protein [Saccharofermentans sp.]